MNLTEVVATGAILCPWPVVVGGAVQTGQRTPISPYCQKKCGSSPACHLSLVGEGEHLCSHGLSYFRLTVAGEPVTIFGLRGELSRNAGHKAVKDALKGRTAALEEIRLWAASVTKLLEAISRDFVNRQAEMLEPLHDPMRLVRQVVKLSQSIAISSTRSQSLDEALARASADMKSLVKASDFLNESFDMLTIYFNPEAASFPKRYSFSLHGMLRKIVSVFSIEDESEAALRSPTIHLSGNSYRTVHLRENFKLVPFALITNAIKYSIEGVIRVTVTENQNTTEVAVESIGPPIEDDEIPLVFKKKFRGHWAKKHSAGTGVGLYLADAIASANGFRIFVSSKPTGRTAGEIPLAINRFWFEVPAR